MEESGQSAEFSEGSITLLYRKWRAGHTEAFGDLYARFWPRLLALANSTLAGRVQSVCDAEDALQSALFSFWEQVEQGRYQENLNRDDLWNILGLITVRKALRNQERERAYRRGGGQIGASAPQHDPPAAGSAAEFDFWCSEYLEMLEPELRSFALLKLIGNKNREIAQELGCTERTVERKLHVIRAIWEEERA